MQPCICHPVIFQLLLVLNFHVLVLALFRRF